MKQALSFVVSMVSLTLVSCSTPSYQTEVRPRDPASSSANTPPAVGGVNLASAEEVIRFCSNVIGTKLVTRGVACQYQAENFRFQREVLQLCSTQADVPDRERCFFGIRNQVYSPTVISICSQDVYQQKSECLSPFSGTYTQDSAVRFCALRFGTSALSLSRCVSFIRGKMYTDQELARCASEANQNFVADCLVGSGTRSIGGSL